MHCPNDQANGASRYGNFAADAVVVGIVTKSSASLLESSFLEVLVGEEDEIQMTNVTTHATYNTNIAVRHVYFRTVVNIIVVLGSLRV